MNYGATEDDTVSPAATFFRSIVEDGFLKVAREITTIAEVLRVTTN